MAKGKIYYDIELFRKIKIEINKHPKEYQEAGKWLDEYCSVDSFWKRQENDLKDEKEYGFIPAEPGSVYVNEDGTAMSPEDSEKKDQRELLIYEKTVEYSELMIKLKKGYFRLKWLIGNWKEHPEIYTTEWLKKELNQMGKVPGKSRLDDAYDFLTADVARSLFIGLEEARRIILITWLLYDPDSENSGLNLTEFESWSWSDRLPSTRKFLACYEKSKGWQTEIVDNPWMKRVRIAWDEIQAAKELETKKLTETEQNKEQFTPEELELLIKIQHHIRNNPNMYREAGKTLDLYCFGSTYRQRKIFELGKTIEKDMYAGTSKEREEEFELYSTGPLPSLLDRIEEVWNSVFLNYHMSPHLDESPFNTIGHTECLTILIIAWLATDKEASYCNLKLTQFEKWPWSFWGKGYTEEEEEIYGTGRSAILKTLIVKDQNWKKKLFDMLDYAFKYVLAGKEFSNSQNNSMLKINAKNEAETEQEIKAGKKPTQWKPPKGYIGSKTIVADYGIPRTTLQGWAEQDSATVKKDKQTRENYYQKKWLEKRHKNYKPRPKA